MCGIVGIYNFNNALIDEDLILAMNEKIDHRGPDDSGIYCNNFIGLGHRRLSILDLSKSGHQPMSNKNKNIHISYNGEIYNYRELRSDLVNKGYKFSSETDTEVLIYLYQEYQDDCVNMLNGMFAFIIWDSDNEIFFVARDRLGQKPLYYTESTNGVAIASEIKALLALPYVEARISQTGLSQFFMHGYSIDSETMFEGVMKLPAGFSMKIYNQKIVKKQYWDIPLNKNSVAKDYVDSYSQLLQDSVDKRMVSDVPIGAFLSGGLDSSFIVSQMQKNQNNKIKTFSVSFPENFEVDEEKDSKFLSNYFNIDHNNLALKKNDDLFEDLEKIIWHLEEPIADPAIIPTYYLSKYASSKVKVVLTGEGSDEINAGYNKYLRLYRHEKLLKITPKFLAKLNSRYNIFRNTGSYIGRVLNYKLMNIQNKLEYLGYFSSKKWIKVLNKKGRNLTNDFQRSKDKTLSILDKKSHFPLLDRILYLDAKTWLADNLLIKVDKMTMAHSIEGRSPFLDYRLVEHAFKVPSSSKLSLNKTKYMFRKIASLHLPSQITNKKQHGFILPLNNWLDKAVEKYINPSNLEKLNYFDVDSVIGMIEMYKKGNQKDDQLIFQIIMLIVWQKAFNVSMK